MIHELGWYSVYIPDNLKSLGCFFQNFINRKKMKQDAFNLKKRKLFVAAVEDFGLPAPKHVCCDPPVRTQCDLVFLEAMDVGHVEVVDTLVESTQDSNNIPADSQSSTEVIFDASFRKVDMYDEASTSWANSGSVASQNDSLSFESRNLSFRDGMEESRPLHQDDTGWHDIDCLDDCFNAHYFKDNKQQTVAELEGFLSSSGVNTNLYVPSPDRWNVDQGNLVLFSVLQEHVLESEWFPNLCQNCNFKTGSYFVTNDHQKNPRYFLLKIFPLCMQRLKWEDARKQLIKNLSSIFQRLCCKKNLYALVFAFTCIYE